MANRQSTRLHEEEFSYILRRPLLSGDIIEVGHMVQQLEAGTVQMATDVSGVITLGVSTIQTDNKLGDATLYQISTSVHKMLQGGDITIHDIGKFCYVSNSQTVTRTVTAVEKANLAGIIVEVPNSRSVYVDFNPANKMYSLNLLSGAVDVVIDTARYDSVYTTVNESSALWDAGGVDYQPDINYLSGQIDINATNISTNTDHIDYLSGVLDVNSDAIGSNTTDIANNAAAIVVNTNSIVSNDADIDYISGAVDVNATDIGVNATNIGNNTSNITTNSDNIALNTAAIEAIEASDADIDYLSGIIDGNTQPFDSVQFNTGATAVASGDGLLQWNANEYTMNIHTGLGPVIQVGKEFMTTVWNNTDTLIPNGSVVYADGSVINNEIGVSLAKSDVFTNFSLGLGVATMDVPLSGVGPGLATRIGTVRDIDTSQWAEGTALWLSTSGGIMTDVKPEFPNYAVQIGAVINSHAVSGEIELNIKDDAEDTFANAWNGCFRESIDFTVESDGTTVSGILTPSNGNVDMTMLFSDGFSLLDTDPDTRIVLTPGTDTNPQRNYVYVTKANKYLEVSTSSWPASSVEHIKVADIILRSAAVTQTDDALKNQNWNDHVRGVNGNGHINHIAEALRRKVGASWLNGTAGTCTVSGTPSDVLVSVTGGQVMQLHEQTFPVLSNNAGDDVHIVNHFTTSYFGVTNLNGQTSDALGNTLANASFSFVLWGVANKTGENSHMMINLPIGKYTKNNPVVAVDDPLNYSVYDIPHEFLGVGFLIARFTFVLQADGTTWSLYDTEDLRGKIPNVTAGGGGGGAGVTDFTGLLDTPSTYTGSGNYFVKVANGETALEFVAEDTSVTDYLSGQIDAITPTISTISTASTATSALSANTDFTLSASNIIDVVRGRVYVNNIDVVPFSDTATVTFYNDSSRRGDEAIYRANMDIVADTMSSGVVSGSTIYSNDGTVFETNDLIYLSGSAGEEFARISSVSTNDLILEDSITNTYLSGSLISLAPEFGGFTLYDVNETETIYGRIVITGSGTVDTTIWMEYK